MSVTMEKIVSLCKRRGFIFQNSEIYGGLANTWDYGPLGVELKRNVKDAWWRAVVYERDDMEGLDAAILMHPRTWEASGHVENFHDPMVDCKTCKCRFREDQIADQQCPEKPSKKPGEGPRCELTQARQFNLMFKTHVGAVEDTSESVYLRPETAQGIFVNFDNVLSSMRRKLPFGIAQIGKSFRNEITPRNFIFRTLEFEQMEVEFFVQPGTDEQWHQQWIDDRFNWYLRFGINKEKLMIREHAADELAHYAKRCVDVEYNFPMGWSELEGIANRTDYDLTKHAEFSQKRLAYFDPATKTHIVPYVIEPSAGVDRSMLAFLVDAYKEETVNERTRTVLALHSALAPIKAAVLPLARNKPEIVETARKLANQIKKQHHAMYDDTAAIGKLYRRQDEIGTPYCITIDHESITDHKATVRDRDTMQQERIGLDQMTDYLDDRL